MFVMILKRRTKRRRCVGSDPLPDRPLHCEQRVLLLGVDKWPMFRNYFEIAQALAVKVAPTPPAPESSSFRRRS